MASNPTRRAELLDRFERATEVPLLVLALLMVPLLFAPWLLDLPEQVESTLLVLDWMIWGCFAFEFAVRLALVERRAQFLRREWIDLLIVLLPVLRPLRIARSARALRLLRLGRVALFLAEATKEGRRLLTRHHLHFALLAAGAVVVFAAGLAFLAEDGGGGPIESFGDSLWWAATTVTTVGYGDTYPVTPAGRGVGVILMLAGITLFGTITANLAAFFVESEASKHASEHRGDAPATRDQIDELRDRIADLEEMLRLALSSPQVEVGPTGGDAVQSVEGQ
jgi:voltage-gated potassium channel